MKQSFTQNHLIKFLYNETATRETLAITEALYDDPRVRREFDYLQQAQQQLPRVKFSPSPSTIKRILAYSERTAVGREA